RAILLGGAPARDDDVVRALDAGLPVVTTYGLSEASSQVTTVRPGAMREALGTAGAPLDGVRVAIEAPDANGVGRIT
ncbi:MAG: 2-succinylbenzoate-CoA ligase, partial [Actinobacteria bacterium]|nr:2-succinylbenzoate--CoA ligase [Actinomycetota bacterium]NIU68817.1 2-succinylbenzoate--CoA ligase [Actinomycetota bacterium]NIW30668.1 2-succinylbenzoate-CoA ligase [Actinomycetota bacterium]NIX23070.1 2-succinylbenzoate-CoA ligase [Actinomycetota bacterium]